MSTTIYEINRKHTLNQTFFDTINTEAKAYFLGLLWADGSLSKTAKRCSGNNRLSISQKIDDIDQLHKMQMALNSNYSLYMSIKLKRYKRTNKAVSLRYGRKQDIISLHQYLYKDATLYNENKHQKFVDFQNRLNGCKSDAL